MNRTLLKRKLSKWLPESTFEECNTGEAALAILSEGAQPLRTLPTRMYTYLPIYLYAHLSIYLPTHTLTYPCLPAYFPTHTHPPPTTASCKARLTWPFWTSTPTHYVLLTTYYLLRTTYYWLLTTYYVPLTTYYLLRTAYYYLLLTRLG